MNKTMFAKTAGPAPGIYYPPYFNFSDEDGKVILRVRAEERKPPHPTVDYPLAGQDVSFELDFGDLMKLNHELICALSRRCGAA